jgi:hypothetical protein
MSVFRVFMRCCVDCVEKRYFIIYGPDRVYGLKIVLNEVIR